MNSTGSLGEQRLSQQVTKRPQSEKKIVNFTGSNLDSEMTSPQSTQEAAPQGVTFEKCGTSTSVHEAVQVRKSILKAPKARTDMPPRKISEEGVSSTSRRSFSGFTTDSSRKTGIRSAAGQMVPRPTITLAAHRNSEESIISARHGDYDDDSDDEDQKKMNTTKSTRSSVTRSMARRGSELLWQDIVEEMSWGRRTVFFIIRSPGFDGFIASVVLVNVVTMGLQSEVKSIERELWFVELVFLGIYTLELIARLYVFRVAVFMRALNWLDITVVLISWLSDVVFVLLVKAEDNSEIANAISALRVFRAMRAMRFVRMLTIFEGLWVSVECFRFCFKPLFWTVVFISVILFIFTMLSVELIGQSADFADVESANNFRSTVPAFVTLFMLFTLDEWRVLLQPIFDKRGWTYPYFFFFLCITGLALMNLVTAVIVNACMRQIESDEQYKTQHMENQQREEVSKIKELFKFFSPQDADEDEDDAMPLLAAVSPEDILHVKGTWKALERILGLLGLHEVEDLRQLLEIFDVDGNGELSLEEVLDGLLQLRHVTEDKYRCALLKAYENSSEKFKTLKRCLDAEPEAHARKLLMIQETLTTVKQQLGLETEELDPGNDTDPGGFKPRLSEQSMHSTLSTEGSRSRAGRSVSTKYGLSLEPLRKKRTAMQLDDNTAMVIGRDYSGSFSNDGDGRKSRKSTETRAAASRVSTTSAASLASPPSSPRNIRSSRTSRKASQKWSSQKEARDFEEDDSSAPKSKSSNVSAYADAGAEIQNPNLVVPVPGCGRACGQGGLCSVCNTLVLELQTWNLCVSDRLAKQAEVLTMLQEATQEAARRREAKSLIPQPPIRVGR